MHIGVHTAKTVNASEVLPCHASNLCGRALTVVAARAWNALPDYITSAPALASFHTLLKPYLFCKTF